MVERKARCIQHTVQKLHTIETGEEIPVAATTVAATK